MSYMWNEFNIKTFPAETIVYRDGVYCPELSTLDCGPINQKYDLPVHIIYVGEISGDTTLDIDVGAENQKVFVTVKIQNKKPAFFNIFIKNAGKNSEVRGHILLENMSELKYNCVAKHLYENTTVLVKNKLVARKGSKSNLAGSAIINKDCNECISDVGFSAITEKDTKIEFMPAQRISSVPSVADHSASIYQPSEPQILFLRQAGLGTFEVQDVLQEAFINDFDLF